MKIQKNYFNFSHLIHLTYVSRLVEERRQTQYEELANTLSHGLGLVLSLVGLPILVYRGWQGTDSLGITGMTIFGIALLVMYLASTLYHATRKVWVKEIFKRLDHAAIFILIAGTYTPFALGVMRGTWGWVLLIVVWSIAAVGIFLKLSGLFYHKHFSTWLYLGMGWIVVLVGKPFLESMPWQGIVLLGLGGLCYSLGVIFFLNEKMKYAHFIWHLFVLGGSIFHFITVFIYGPRVG